MRRACRDDAGGIKVDEPHGSRAKATIRSCRARRACRRIGIPELCEDMRRLDVAVHDAERMERIEPVRERGEQRPRLRLRQPLPRDAPILERAPADILLDDDCLVLVLGTEKDLRPQRRRCTLMRLQERERQPARMEDPQYARPPRLVRYEPHLAARRRLQQPHALILAREKRLRRIEHDDTSHRFLLCCHHSTSEGEGQRSSSFLMGSSEMVAVQAFDRLHGHYSYSVKYLFYSVRNMRAKNDKK